MTPIQALEEVLHDWARVYGGREPDEVLRPLCVRLALRLINRPELRRHVQEHRTDRLRPAPDFVARLAGVARRLREAPLGRLAEEDPDVASFLVRHPHVIPFLLEQQRSAAAAAAAKAVPFPPLPLLPSLTSHALLLGHGEFTPAEAAADRPASGTLLERARAGGAEDWQRLAQLLVPLIDHWCRSAGLSESDARQLAPSVLEKAQAELDASPREGSFRGRLRALTAAAVADFAARQGRSAVAPEGTAEAESRLLIRGALELFGSALDGPTREVGRRLLVQGEGPGDVARALNMTEAQVCRVQARVRGLIDAEVGDLLA